MRVITFSHILRVIIFNYSLLFSSSLYAAYVSTIVPPKITAPSANIALAASTASVNFSWNAALGADAYLVRLEEFHDAAMTLVSKRTPFATNTNKTSHYVFIDRYKNLSLANVPVTAGKFYRFWIHSVKLKTSGFDYGPDSEVNFSVKAVAPAPAPTPIIATNFKVGDKVETVTLKRVRFIGQVTSTSLLGEQPPGAIGTLVGGPTQTKDANGTITWWKIDFQSGVDGFVGEDNLKLYVAPLASCDGIASGGTQNRTMFQESSVPHGSVCASQPQTRTCNNGTWSAYTGTYANPLCVVQSAPAPVIATNFKVGDKIELVTFKRVRSVGEITATSLLGEQPAGAIGTLIAGPTQTKDANGTITWWKVDFQGGIDGFVGEDNLKVYVQSQSSSSSSSQSSTPPVDTSPVVAGSVVKRSSVTRHDITWNFNREYDVAQYINGDWAVVVPVGGTVTVSSVNIAGKTAAQRDAEMAEGLHGSAVNQNIDTHSGSAWAPNYVATAKYPLSLSAGDSLISFIGLTSADRNCDHKAGTAILPGRLNVMDYCERLLEHTFVRGASVLTVVSSVPAVGAFRPSPLGDATNRKNYRVSNIDALVDSLPNLQIEPSKMFSIEKLIRARERFQFEGINTWQRRYSAPGDNQATYSAYSYNGEGLLALAVNYPRDRKKALLIATLQHGIDLEGAARLGGLRVGEGGHANNLLSVLAVTSELLKNPSFSSVMSIARGNGEQYQTYIGKNDVALWGQNCSNPVYFTNQCINGAYAGGPKDCRDPNGVYDQLYKPSGIGICVEYQTLNGPYYPAQALAMGLLGAVDDYGHIAFFKYSDRYMDLSGYLKSPAFVGEMWNAHRNKASW